MSRVIKFRAWDSSRKKIFTSPKWVEFKVDATGELKAVNYNPNGDEQRLTVMQFTGLTDVNGVEIYEGDIIKGGGVVTFNTDNFAGLPAFHVCNKDGETLDYYYGVAADESCAVIGNIYQNPELVAA